MAPSKESKTFMLDLTEADDSSRRAIKSVLHALKSYTIIDAYNFIVTKSASEKIVTLTVTYTIPMEKSTTINTHRYRASSCKIQGWLDELLEALHAHAIIDSWDYNDHAELDAVIKYRRPIKPVDVGKVRVESAAAGDQ